MSASLIVNETTAKKMLRLMFSSKKLEKLAKEITGHVGWEKTIEGEIVEYIYIKTPGAVQEDWVLAETHRKNVEAKKEANRRRYSQNPLLLEQKIAAKKTRGRDWFH